MINLDEIRARCDAATPEPWMTEIRGNTVQSHCVVCDTIYIKKTKNICSGISPKTKNAEFIAHARTDIPALLAYIKELTTQLAEAERKEISTIPCYVCGGEVIEFTVPNDIWNLVMRPDGKETDKEYLCIGCWHKALRSKLESLTTQLAEAKADYEAAVEDMAHDCKTCLHNNEDYVYGEHCQYCGCAKRNGWIYRGRKDNG